MAVRFSITVFLASIILFVSVIVLVNVAIIIWGLAASSFSSLSSRVKAWWHSRPVLLFRLGGVTTQRRKLNYTCSLCQDSMEAGEKVRTLSCDHAFHCGGSARCERDIDQWLLTAEVMACPLCRKSPYPVLPWKQPPPSSPAPSPSALEPALQQLPRTSATPDLDLEKALLLPAHDETLAEASSSASAPPLAQTQLPRTSTPDLAGVLPLLADDEILPEASSSQ